MLAENIVDDVPYLVSDWFEWSYPLYVVRNPAGLACLAGERLGEVLAALCVFTDEDLASAYAANQKQPSEPVPMADAPAFERRLSKLKVATAVVFDPPPGGGEIARCVTVDALLRSMDRDR